MESKAILLKKLAVLESANDQLCTELVDIDQLMRLVGFTNGIAGLKETAQEFCEESEEIPYDEAI
jgi:hypothetical protein